MSPTFKTFGAWIPASAGMTALAWPASVAAASAGLSCLRPLFAERQEPVPRQHRVDVLDGMAARNAEDLAPTRLLEAELVLYVQRGGIVGENAGTDAAD